MVGGFVFFNQLDYRNHLKISLVRHPLAASCIRTAKFLSKLKHRKYMQIFQLSGGIENKFITAIAQCNIPFASRAVQTLVFSPSASAKKNSGSGKKSPALAENFKLVCKFVKIGNFYS